MAKFFCFSLLTCLFLQCSICYSWQNLDFLDLGSNLIEGPLPSSLCKLGNLQYLLLSDNKLSGTIPDCFGNMSKQLTVLDLRRNNFHGKIPTDFPKANTLRNLGLNGNQLEGPLPRSLLDCNSLEVLDVGNNMIKDTFPMWLGALPELSVLILKSNQMYGTIGATSNSSFRKLRILDISFNQFTGTVPTPLIENFQAMKKINQSQTKDAQYMGDSSYYEDSVTLVMKGLEFELKRIFTVFTTIDLSNNCFEGSIPNSIGELHSLVVLNFSRNLFNGSIPSAMGDLSALESLDLSRNELGGRIPAELATLDFLGTLNLSYNQLVGRIPSGRHFDTFSNSSFVGNPGLCGSPLAACEEPFRESPGSDHPDPMMIGLTWESVLFGFISGMILGVLMGGLALYIQQPKWYNEIVEDVCKLSKQRPRQEGLGWQKIRSY